MKLKNNTKKTAIILPLKENYTKKDFGAVSIWVSDYIKFSKEYDQVIFCKKKILKKNT